MIRLPNRALPRQTQAELDACQKTLDALPDYAMRVKIAAQMFETHSRKGNKTFDVIKNELTQMCSGAQRCGYCEDSAADEIEHIKPKSLYPEATFVWLNFLYACGACNRPKNNRYAVFDPRTTKLVDARRRRNASVMPPPPGAPVLIDPRIEDPCDFLWLDLLRTFYFSPRAGINAIDYERAKYTIEVLRLNQRGYLRSARQQAYADYLAQLKQYRADRDGGASHIELRAIETHIRGRSHPTVWSEMKRQRELIPALKKLFHDVPEALAW